MAGFDQLVRPAVLYPLLPFNGKALVRLLFRFPILQVGVHATPKNPAKARIPTRSPRIRAFTGGPSVCDMMEECQGRRYRSGAAGTRAGPCAAKRTKDICSSAAATPWIWRADYGTPLYVLDEGRVREAMRATGGPWRSRTRKAACCTRAKRC